MDGQPKATIAGIIVGQYRDKRIERMDQAEYLVVLDDIERQVGQALEEASAGNAKLLGAMGELAKRAAAAETLAQHYGEHHREAAQDLGAALQRELTASKEAKQAQDALTELKGKHAVLSGERMRLIGYLDAIDPMVDVPQPPLQMTRRRYVLNSGPRPTPADMYAAQNSGSSKPWWEL